MNIENFISDAVRRSVETLYVLALILAGKPYLLFKIVVSLD